MGNSHFSGAHTGGPQELQCAPLPRVPLPGAPRLSGKSMPVVGVQTWLHGYEDSEKSPSLITSLLEATLHLKGF